MRKPDDSVLAGGAVLVGGSSTRMGLDKATMVVDGTAMAARTARALVEAGLEPVVAIGGDALPILELGLDHIVDKFPGEGPLGGIITALDSIQSNVVVILACDVLDPAPESILESVRELGSHQLAVPMVGGREQWLHAAWRSDCLPELTARFQQGVRSVKSAVVDLDLHRFDGGDPAPFADSDEPSDLAGRSSPFSPKPRR